MTKASIAEAKAHLSSLISQVKNGEEVVITDRGKPVARLVPIQADLDEATMQMVKLGLIRLPTVAAKLPPLRALSQDPVLVDREDRV